MIYPVLQNEPGPVSGEGHTEPNDLDPDFVPGAAPQGVYRPDTFYETPRSCTPRILSSAYLRHRLEYRNPAFFLLRF